MDGIGIDAHRGLRPEDMVMRICAEVFRENRITKRRARYFFKLAREYASNLILERLYRKPYRFARAAIRE